MAGTPPSPLALVGPTATGKTEASIAIAERLGAEIVCVDSMLIYRGMDAGTAKPTAEQRMRVPHHLLDLADPAESFSVARFQEAAERALASIGNRGRLPLLVGSGGLYYRAIVDRLEFPGTDPGTRGLLEAEVAVLGPERLFARLRSFDPAAARRIEAANTRRTVRALEVAAITGRRFSSYAHRWDHYAPLAVRAAGVEVTRETLHRRIERRVEAMLPRLLAETEALLKEGLGRFLTSSQAIGYAEAVACLRGSLTPEQAGRLMVRRTKALARRQLAWLRRDPRIRWFRAGDDGAVGIVEDLAGHLRAVAPDTPVRAEAVR
jgi:tRNA dimethylallyltransferase